MKRYTYEEAQERIAMFAAKGTDLGCIDCGRPWGVDGWICAIVPDEVWEIINPTYDYGSGMLCILCISHRCEIAGLKEVPVRLCGMEPLRAVGPKHSLFAHSLFEYDPIRIRLYRRWMYFRSMQRQRKWAREESSLRRRTRTVTHER